MAGATRHRAEGPWPVAAGQSIGGFTLVRQLGAGGMGQTWEAVRRLGAEFEQRVAIKMAMTRTPGDRQGRALLSREASLAASLRHPNIAAVLDWNEDDEYIVCELVEGADLRAVMHEAPQGRFSTPLLVYTIAQLARGLSHAHRRVLHGEPSPVIHRDMSPGNVVADYDGNLKIIDFGIARATGSPHQSQNLRGKLVYMAPEQIQGEPLDSAVDQYALGVIAYELATGVRPNDGASDSETWANIVNGRHMPVGRRLPDIPSGLGEVIERMLSVRREDRFADMDELVDALEPFVPPLGIHRSMAALVQRARPHHTIIQEGNRFVSRPARLDPKRADEDGPSEEWMATQSGVRGAHLLTTQTSEIGLAATIPEARHLAQQRRSLLGGLVARFELTRSQRRGALGALGAVAVVLLGAVGWRAAMSGPPGLAEPAPLGVVVQPARGSSSTEHNPAQPSPPTMAPVAVDPTLASALPDPERMPDVAVPAPAAPSAAPRAEKRGGNRARRQTQVKEVAAGGGPNAVATLRVKAFPWGRVWIDGEVKGSVPPILEVRLPPGTHTVAVGRDTPSETRNVTLRAADERLISFELEGL
jgi:eukaryotic-like serine/threonine-protein kinase